MLRFCALIALVVAVLACATEEAPPPVGRTVASPSHGWIELSVTDSRIPADPISQLEGKGLRPPTCDLELTLNDQSVFSELLRPSGSSPPYFVDSMFRFPAAPGDHDAVVYYSGCRTYGQQLDGREAALRISVRRGHLTRMRFDGAVLVAFPPTAR